MQGLCIFTFFILTKSYFRKGLNQSQVYSYMNIYSIPNKN